MLRAVRNFLALALLVAAGAALAAEIKPYVREDLASDVVRLTETLRKETAQIGAKIKGKSVEQLRKDAAAAIAPDNFKDASALLGAAISLAPKDAASWLALARLAAQADDAQANGRYDLVQRGQTAAYAAYQRAKGAAEQAEALALLGNLFARQEMWRPALDAYRASLDRRDDEDTRKIYEDMREKHGFRILDYKVDNDPRAPRVCFTLLRVARPQDRFRALCRRRRRRRYGHFQRGSADLRRRPQARRALCDRHPRGPAVGGRRIAAQIGRL